MSQRKIALFVLLGLDAALLGALAFVGQWWAFGMFAAITIVVLAAELASWLATKDTISRHFWKFKEKHPVWAWIIALLPVFALSALAWHLLS